MSSPALSIIIPVYNASDAISNIVSDITSQDFKDFELILVDDGSTDDTLQKLTQLSIDDERIVVESQQNGGPSSARNKGIKLSCGQYIQFYDSDDRVFPGALSKVVAAIQKFGSDLVISGWQINLQMRSGVIVTHKRVSPKKNVIDNDLTDYILSSIGESGELYNLWNKLFRGDIIRDNKLFFDESLKFGEDILFALEYFKYTDQLCLIPDVTYAYQANSDGSVFSQSSIVPEYRYINDQAILDFAGEEPSGKRADLVSWVRWRWLISYWMLVVKSKKSRKEKRRLLTEFRPKNLQFSNRSGTLGLKRVMLERLARLVSPYPALIAIFARILLLLKDLSKYSSIYSRRLFRGE